MESCPARRLVSRRIAEKGEEEATVGARVGDIRRWNRFVATVIGAVDENVSYFFTDLLFAGSSFSPFKTEFNPSSVSA